jgi:uncharacterized membrane protein
MLADIPIRFEYPYWLLLLLLIVPALLISLRSLGSMSRTKAWVTFSIRAVLIMILTLTLTRPHWVKRGEGLTVTVLLDRSQSIPAPLKQWALETLRAATEQKEDDEDRLAVITVTRDANIAAMPSKYSTVTAGLDEGDPTATNLAAGVRLALVTMPDDTANRIVLVSDGNETMEYVEEAAQLAKANDVPIDVFVLKYQHDNEVIFEQIVAPSRERQGRTAELRLVLRSQRATKGNVRLDVNGVPYDLNGDEPGVRLPIVTEDGGLTVIRREIELTHSGPYEFEASFEPDDPADDEIDRNNSAVAVTFVGGKGKVLIVDDGITESRFLVEALREADITAEVRSPAALAGGMVFLSTYDAVVLVNIPSYALPAQDLDLMLHNYVHDLGGGLVMIGGTTSFGAGGWIDTKVAKAMPVEMNPPQNRQMPAGALALVMHSCEMPQGNFWGQKVAQSAIEALSRLDYVGIVEFAWGMGGKDAIEGCDWAFDMQRLGDKTAALQATKTMQVGDMPKFGPSMQLALKGLTSVPAAQKHAIIISDGDPMAPSKKLVDDFIANKVTVTTVMVGGHGTGADRQKMQWVANATGGRFYNVKNPKTLPQIFIKEAQVVSRSLIQDGDVYEPSVVSTLPGPAQGFNAVPSIDGYVLTAPRTGLAQTPIVIQTKDANDPLFAHWNYGLGRSIAYTSDLQELWGSRWASWARFQAFWEQAIRWVMRPSSPTNIDIRTHLEGDRAIVEIEALEGDAGFLNFLSTNAVVSRPDHVSEKLALEQTGPGRYRGEFEVDDDGAYLVHVAYSEGATEDAEQGYVQAAVSVPYPREFRSVMHDAAKLERVAEITGGRIIEAEDPRDIDLFYARNVTIPLAPKEIWDVLAIIAASLLVIDVAARRLAVDPKRLAAAAGKAVGRRGEVTEQTVAAWKRARAQVSHRRSPRAEAEPAKDQRYEASEEDAQRAIDVGAETPADMSRKPAAATRAESTPDAGADDDQGEYTTRLLAAKRRAREEERQRRQSEDGSDD